MTSDFDLNREVAELLGMNPTNKSSDGSSVFIRSLGTYVDFCHNPDDAIPLAKEARISCIAEDDSEWWVASHGKIRFSSKNMLRAITFVFLMIKKVSNG